MTKLNYETHVNADIFTLICTEYNAEVEISFDLTTVEVCSIEVGKCSIGNLEKLVKKAKKEFTGVLIEQRVGGMM